MSTPHKYRPYPSGHSLQMGGACLSCGLQSDNMVHYVHQMVQEATKTTETIDPKLALLELRADAMIILQAPPTPFVGNLCHRLVNVVNELERFLK